MGTKTLPAVKEENLPAIPDQQPRSIAQLAGALSKAQQKCKAAVKDATNSFHRYKYASAEAVITEAKQALQECSLAVFPLETTLNGGNGSWELVRKFLLVHDSGQAMPLLVAWPVVLDKGRPLDKAVAIAATASLGYLLRDLLLMPRVDQSDDLAGTPSNAEPEQPAPQPEPEPAAAPEPPPRITDEQQGELSALIRDTGTDVAKVLAHYRLRVLAQLSAAEFDGLRQALLAKKPAQAGCITAEQFQVLDRLWQSHKVIGKTWLQFLGLNRGSEIPAAWFHWLRLMSEQGTEPGILDRVMGIKKFSDLPADQVAQLTLGKLRDKIDSLVSDLKIDTPTFKARAKELYGTDDPGTLGVEQLVDLETKLEAVKAQRKP